MDEAEISRRLREERDPEIFRLFVELWGPRVFRLVVSILGPWSDGDAEDVVQDIFLRAWERLGQFRGDASIGTWLYRIAWTQAINRRQTARIRLPHVSIDTLTATGAGDEAALSALSRKEVAVALEQLPDLYRTTIHLHYWLGCSVAEIGEVLGAPEGTVKSYLSRARDRMRRILSESKGAAHA